MTDIAIIGGGPRALWALERLSHRDDVEVDVFTGGSPLGVGAAYATDQPDHLRLNVTSATVDVWSPDDADGPSYDSWAGDLHLPADPFPPRAQVGRYLREQADVVCARLGDRVRVHDRRVDDLSRHDDGWLIDGDGPWQQVLLATGHEPDWPGALAHAWREDIALQPRVFPTDWVQDLPRGATVVVRGAALTAIDAVLSMVAADPSVRVVLVSRSGRLMHPKTDPDVLAGLIDWQAEQQHATALAFSDLSTCEVLAETASRLPGAGDGIADSDFGNFRAEGAPAEELRRALDVARGDEKPDHIWAQAQAWRLAYPALVALQAREDPYGPVLGLPDWVRLAVAMERVAFGPPPVNAARLLELLEAGTVNVRRGETAAVAREVGADLVVDAVLAPPGVRQVCADSLIGRLVRRGVLTPAPYARGAVVDECARALDRGGRPVPGLAVIGRATEDVVLGNDTLIRSLHPQVGEWVRHVV